MGNIASRSDIAGGAVWTYDPAKKHEVTQAGSASYAHSHDANGNVITRNGQTVSWSSYNYPTSISSPGESVQLNMTPSGSAGRPSTAAAQVLKPRITWARCSRRS